MTDEMYDFTNLLILKNHLGTQTRSDIVELYQDMDDYINFIDTFVYLTQVDSGFLLLNPDFLESVLTVIQIHRFDVDDAEIREIVNSIIEYINRIKAMDDDKRKILMNGYLTYHEEQREATFHETDAFIASIAYDAIVLKALYEGDLSIIKDHKLAIMSLNYLTKVCPEMFQDEEVKQRALALLDICMKGNRMFDGCKRHAKALKKKFNYDLEIEKME